MYSKLELEYIHAYFAILPAQIFFFHLHATLVEIKVPADLGAQPKFHSKNSPDRTTQLV
jgi:hypothetical protein